MLRGKILACLLVGTLGTVAVAAPLGAVAVKQRMDRGRLADTPLGRLLSGHLGRLLVLRSEMNVTDEQREKIKDVLVEHKPEIAEAAKGVWEKRSALRDAVLDNEADEAAIRRAADELGKAIGDAAVLGSKIRGQVAPILTDKQKELIKECRSDCQAATQKLFQQTASSQ